MFRAALLRWIPGTHPSMSTSNTASAPVHERRLLLVDFDWQDADLMPELLQRPGVSVRLVAGARHEDAGIRLAELCGLPRTVDLADLTREIFDLALVSERSPRRTQIEGLLLALGVPSTSPQAYFAGESDPTARPAVEAPLAMHAAAFESSVGGGDFDAIMEQSLPDVSDDAPTMPPPVVIHDRGGVKVQNLEEFPSPEDRFALETALRSLMEQTGAGRAEVRIVGPDQVETRVEVGPADTLLASLVELASGLGTPQIVAGLAGTQEGKAWGAWPFRTPQHSGVVAAAGIDPQEGRKAWENMVDEMRTKWDERDRAQAGPAFPLLPDRHPRWLTQDEFSSRLELAVERNRHDGMRFAVHRLAFPGSPGPVRTLCDRLPSQLRDTDCMLHPAPDTVVLLMAGAPAGFVHLRKRLMVLWEQALAEAGETIPDEPVADEQVQIVAPAGAENFVRTARGWSGPSSSA
jgi:hypothetical protein